MARWVQYDKIGEYVGELAGLAKRSLFKNDPDIDAILDGISSAGIHDTMESSRGVLQGRAQEMMQNIADAAPGELSAYRPDDIGQLLYGMAAAENIDGSRIALMPPRDFLTAAYPMDVGFPSGTPYKPNLDNQSKDLSRIAKLARAVHPDIGQGFSVDGMDVPFLDLQDFRKPTNISTEAARNQHYRNQGYDYAVEGHQGRHRALLRSLLEYPYMLVGLFQDSARHIPNAANTLLSESKQYKVPLKNTLFPAIATGANAIPFTADDEDRLMNQSIEDILSGVTQ